MYHSIDKLMLDKNNMYHSIDKLMLYKNKNYSKGDKYHFDSQYKNH